MFKLIVYIQHKTMNVVIAGVLGSISAHS